MLYWLVSLPNISIRMARAQARRPPSTLPTRYITSLTRKRKIALKDMVIRVHIRYSCGRVLAICAT